MLFQVSPFKSCGFLKYRYLPQTLGYTRVLISVSKRVGSAPQRNRLKRLIRETLRSSGYLQSRSMDCAIFITKPLLKKPTLEDINRYVMRFFSNLPDDYTTKDQ